jgi:hypothetical protein
MCPGSCLAKQTKIEKPSAQSLLITLRFYDQVLATGTAIVVEGPHGPYLVTNRHNLTGRDQNSGKPLSDWAAIPNNVLLRHHSEAGLGAWLQACERLYDDNDQPNWHEHPTLGAACDVVALPLTQLQGVHLYPYDISSLAKPIMVRPSDVLSVVGFPFGESSAGPFGIWVSGFVASELSLDYRGLPIFLIDCRTRKGQSGSPVIAHRAGGMVALAGGSSALFDGPVTSFLGLYSGRINSESDIGIVWKASAVREVVWSAG